MEDIENKQKQTKHFMMKNIMPEMKNTLDTINRLVTTKEE